MGVSREINGMPQTWSSGIVPFSVLLAFGTLSYLFGSLMVRWKMQTLIVVTVLFVLFITLIGSTDLLTRIIKVFRFMFLDHTTGLFIVLKQVVFAAIIWPFHFRLCAK